MQNLLNSTDIVTVSLDSELNIKRFTEHATQLVMLRRTEVGRPISELASNLKHNHLVDELPSRAKSITRVRTFCELCPHEEFMQAIDDALLNSHDLKQRRVESQNPS